MMRQQPRGVAVLVGTVLIRAMKAKAETLRNAINVVAIALALTLIGATGAMANNSCGTPQVSTLWAAQSIDVGSVTVKNNANYLFVTYKTKNGWKLTEAHLYVLDEEPTKRLPPGQAPYKVENLAYATTYTFKVPLAGPTCGETAKWLQAHAAVVKLDSAGNEITSQTAYGGTVTKPSKGAWYGNIKYVVQCCGTGGQACTEEETAWGGNTAGGGRAWWFYYQTVDSGAQTVWAGQHTDAGDVTVICTGTLPTSTCRIMIELTSGWGLQAVDESVKIQGYTQVPSSRPAAGLFDTYKGTAVDVTVPYSPYYAIHLDVGQPPACKPTSVE